MLLLLLLALMRSIVVELYVLWGRQTTDWLGCLSPTRKHTQRVELRVKRLVVYIHRIPKDKSHVDLCVKYFNKIIVHRTYYETLICAIAVNSWATI